MKRIRIILVCCMAVLLTACSFVSKNYEAGVEKLKAKDFVAAESYFKKAIDEGYNKNDIDVIYEIVSEYNLANKCYSDGEYEKGLAHIGKIPSVYSKYSIVTDVDSLKEKLTKSKEIDDTIAKVKNLFEYGEYSEANALILQIDTQQSTDKQNGEIQELQKQIQIKKKNEDATVLAKINTLVRTYANGLCEAVNTGQFKPLSGTLYKDSAIYNEQKSYIARMATKDIYEYCLGIEVSSVSWTSETECVISTIETYQIYNYTAEDYSSQTFRYTYDVIETADGQLFLTTIRKSN